MIFYSLLTSGPSDPCYIRINDKRLKGAKDAFETLDGCIGGRIICNPYT